MIKVVHVPSFVHLNFSKNLLDQLCMVKMQTMQAENPKLRVFGWARRFATSPPCITKEDVAMQMAVQVEFPHSTAVAV